MNSDKLTHEKQTYVLLNLEQQNFNYTTLDTKIQIIVQQRTTEIKSLIHRTAQDTIDIGNKLIEIKEHLGHGKFLNWLKSEFDWSLSTAARFMQVSEQFKFVNLTNLHIAPSALYLLAAPSTPKKARVEILERASLGEHMTYSVVKAVISQHKKLLKSPRSDIISAVSKNIETKLSDETLPLATVQTENNENDAITRVSENEPLEDEKQIREDYNTSNCFSNITSTLDNGNYPPIIQTQMKAKSPFKVGHDLCIIDFEQQNHKWFGKVAEIKKTNTDIEVVIRISHQSAELVV